MNTLLVIRIFIRLLIFFNIIKMVLAFKNNSGKSIEKCVIALTAIVLAVGVLDPDMNIIKYLIIFIIIGFAAFITSKDFI